MKRKTQKQCQRSHDMSIFARKRRKTITHHHHYLFPSASVRWQHFLALSGRFFDVRPFLDVFADPVSHQHHFLYLYSRQSHLDHHLSSSCHSQLFDGSPSACSSMAKVGRRVELFDMTAEVEAVVVVRSCCDVLTFFSLRSHLSNISRFSSSHYPSSE